MATRPTCSASSRAAGSAPSASPSTDGWWPCEPVTARRVVGTAARRRPGRHGPARGPAAARPRRRSRATAPAARRRCSTRRPWATPYAARAGSPTPRPSRDDPAPAETLAVAPVARRPDPRAAAHAGPGRRRVPRRARPCTGSTRPQRPVASSLPGCCPRCSTWPPRAPYVERRGPWSASAGRWLAARNPDWSWVADEGRAEQAADRVSAIAALRSADPDAGRALVEQTWDTDGAQHRAAAVAALLVGPGSRRRAVPRALPRRPGQGRPRGGRRLLDRLPGSARAARMADRLRPLLDDSGGTLRKRLEVAAARRPRRGGGPRRPGRPRTGRLPARPLAASRSSRGAPLEVWTDAVARRPDKVRGDGPRLRGRRCVLSAARRGRRPARPRLGAGPARRPSPDTRLLALLPADERERHLRRPGVGRAARRR